MRTTLLGRPVLVRRVAIRASVTHDERGHDDRDHDERGHDVRGRDVRGHDVRGHDERALQLLTPAERETYCRIPGVADARRFVAGRTLVRRTFADLLDVPPHRIQLGVEDSGRPRLANPRHSGLDFNLSHAGAVVVLAVGAGVRVGIDVECTDRVTTPGADHGVHGIRHDPVGGADTVDRAAAIRLAHRYFCADEVAQLDRSRCARHFARTWTRIWTTREAHAKARGVGVRGLADPLDGHGRRWQRGAVRVPAGYVASVVALPPSPPLPTAHPTTRGRQT